MALGSHLYDEQQERNTRSMVLATVAACAVLLLLLRLVKVQIVDGERNRRLSGENRMQLQVLPAPRGRIFDRNGEVLARNRPSYSICVLPYKLRHADRVIDVLCNIRDSAGAPVFEREDLEETIRLARRRRFEATRLKEDVSIELVSIVEEHLLDLPGIVVETEARREYTLGPAAFHVLGYMGGIPESDFDSLKAQGYAYGDLIGKAGLEKQYESLLRGANGQEYVEVNAYGKRMGTIPDMPRTLPVPGRDLTLTIDVRLQREAATALPDSLRGAVVVMQPATGEILAMVSKPAVNPNIFSLASSIRSQEWQTVALDTTLPLNNRATVGLYIPGSTFKLVSALAGLSGGWITAQSRMARTCAGVYYFGRLPKRCWAARGHGSLTVVEAIQRSCNVFFYQLGLMIGDSAINNYAFKLGLGTLSGIDLPEERGGWLSGSNAYNLRHKARGWVWTDGLLLDHAIGQTQSVTPIALAVMVSTLGTGRRVRPHLLKEVRTHDGAVVRQVEPEVVETLEADSAALAVVREGMAKVPEPGGTAAAARVPGVVVGGKTGSAEWKKGELTHGLFVGCAPMESPEIALAVVVEQAGHGGAVAAPVAGKILRYYFEQIAPRPKSTAMLSRGRAQRERTDSRAVESPQ